MLGQLGNLGRPYQFLVQVELYPRTGDCVLFPAWLPHRVGEMGSVAKVKLAGVAQKLGRPQSSDRYFQSNCRTT